MRAATAERPPALPREGRRQGPVSPLPTRSARQARRGWSAGWAGWLGLQVAPVGSNIQHFLPPFVFRSLYFKLMLQS